MKITKELIAKGWKKDASGTWRAPVTVAQESKRERITIEESRTLGPGWVRVPVVQPNQAAQIAGWKRFGLSDDEALIAAGVVKPSPRNDVTDTPFGLLRKNLERVHRHSNLTD